MKLKVLSALLLSALSINALAESGHGYRIISERSSHTKGFIAGGIIHQDSAKKNYLIVATVMAFNASGSVGLYTKVQGDHTVGISNTTQQVQRYTYRYTLHCEQADEWFEKTVELQPQGAFHDFSHTYGAVIMEHRGHWPIVVTTSVTGAESDTKTESAELSVT